jgi:hypothetical protein
MKIISKIKSVISNNKSLLLGGIAGGLIYYGNVLAESEPWYPKELNQQLEPHLPKNGDLLAAAAPPAILYSIVKFGKKKELSKIADGSILFGVPTLLARTVVQAAWTEGIPKTSLGARFNNAARYNSAPRPRPTYNNAGTTSKYIPNNSASRPAAYSSGISKYTITS